MITFDAVIDKFKKQGEKTGWTYVSIPHSIAKKLNPSSKKSFRIKGKINKVPVEGLTLLPVGEGNYILALNATLRKKIKKPVGEKIRLQIELDNKEYRLPQDLTECLQEVPEANDYFLSLPKSHQNYFGKWIDEAKTEATRTKRITHTILALSQQMDFGQMLRSMKSNKDLPPLHKL